MFNHYNCDENNTEDDYYLFQIHNKLVQITWYVSSFQGWICTIMHTWQILIIVLNTETVLLFRGYDLRGYSVPVNRLLDNVYIYSIVKSQSKLTQKQSHHQQRSLSALSSSIILWAPFSSS